jgi:hypothetical protein
MKDGENEGGSSVFQSGFDSHDNDFWDNDQHYHSVPNLSIFEISTIRSDNSIVASKNWWQLFE